MSPIPSSFFQPITYDYPKTEILSLPCKKITRFILLSDNWHHSPCSFGTIYYFYQPREIPYKIEIVRKWPLFKSDHEKGPNNYRPMSLLSNFHRIFERLMYTRMINYIEKHNSTLSSQCGFRKGHSTQHAI